MHSKITHKQAAGFTLIELLVAMAIGLITVVVIGQVMAVSEAQKRTATTGADAMVNAALALFTVERDIKGAGYGLVASLSALGCEVRAQHGGASFPFTLAPVSIVDGPAGAPDEIRVLASAKNGIAMPTTITVDHPRSAANFFVDSDLGVQVGDMMIAVPASPSAGNWCSVFQVTGTGGGGGGGQNQGQGQNQVLHNSGQSDWNQAGGQTIFPDVSCPSGAQHQAYCPGDYLINLGQMLDHTYKIDGTNLHLTEFMTATPAAPTERDLYPQIVQMQAVYGKDTDNDCVVDAWNATLPTTPAEWQQIRAVRMALVARSQLVEKTTVTLDEANVAASQRCDSATPHAAVVCWRPNPANAASGVAINLNINDANPDWQRYRYRVYETAIPVRNLIWLQKTAYSTCDI